MKVRLAVISLRVEDVREAAHFYRDVIGLELLSHHSDRPHFDLGGYYLVLLQGKSKGIENAIPSRFPVLAFVVENLDEAIQRLKSHTIELPWGIEEDASSRWVMFQDPSMNIVEFVEFK